MAPETITKGLFTRASDMYSFGVLGWELLHEEEAFKGLNEFAIIDGIVNSSLKLEFADHSAPHLVQLLAACMNLQPEERPCSKALCECLMALLKNKK